MTPVVYGPDSEANRVVGDLVSRIIWGKPGCFSNFCSMGVVHNGELVAGTVYNNWNEDHGVIELSSGTTTPRWLTRPVVQTMFRVPFDMIGARLCVLRVSEHNTRMREIAIRFGFDETIIPRVRADNEAECVYTLSKDDWRNHKIGRK